MAKKEQHMEEGGEFLFKRGRNRDEHIKSCGDGYRSGSHEVHHILCVHACSDATFPKSAKEPEINFICACFEITSWNINAAPNNIGLPKKWAYVRDRKAGWNGLPCHQLDHDLYLTAVAKYVEDKIWARIFQAKKQRKCEALTSEAIASYFEAGSAKWKSHLVARGAKYGGTKACFDYCIKGTSGPMSDSNWHISFSMAPTEAAARKRIKPVALRRLGLLAKLIK